MNCESFEQEIQRLRYPVKDDFKIYNVYKSGEIIARRATNVDLYSLALVLVPQGKRGSLNTYNCAKKLRYLGYLVEEEFDEVAYNESTGRYQQAKADVIARFKQYLFEKYKVTSSPKAEFLWSRCWEQGHSSGFYEVEIVFIDWVDILSL